VGKPRITVIGTGYLGATHSACLAELGFDVLGVDVDEDKVSRLSRGEVPFFEPGLEAVVQRNLRAGRLAYTTSFAEAGAFGEVHFLCVGTPPGGDGFAADLQYVYGALKSLLPHLRAGALLVGKSTVPAGTADRIAERLADTATDGVELAWNPEFLREGFAVADSLRPDRIVIGVCSQRAEHRLREVYRPLTDAGVPLVVTDYATAELVKVAANAFLATKVSFINAMAEVCEATGADVTQLAKVLSYDARIGGRYLNAGLGFGGGCLPKDIRAFMARARELGVDQALSFLGEVDGINRRRRARVVELARELLAGSLRGRRVGVLGAAFKPDSDDVRDSPALDVASACQAQGAVVRVYDPKAMDNARRAYPHLACAESALAAAEQADVVLHLTEWREFREMDPARLAEVVAAKRIVDGRNALDKDRWREGGWAYRALGRP
jgi:UDPglucose 6-dehydrogenase